MACYECEYCGKRFRRRPVNIARTKFHKVVCRDPKCFSKLMKWIAEKREAQKRGHRKSTGGANDTKTNTTV